MDTLLVKTAEDIGLVELNLAESGNDQNLISQSEQVVDSIFGLDVKDLRAQQNKARSVRELGAGVQREICRRSSLLKQPMTKLVDDAEDGGEVAQALLALQVQTDKINPNQIDFTMGGIRRLLAKIPGIGSPLSRWLAKYQSVDGVIQEIVKSLEDGQRQLERDNTTLKDDQITMRELINQLQGYVDLGGLMDRKISARLESEVDLDTAKRAFVEEEILFPLRQRIIDLQQQMAVNQQGVLTTEVIIRNNRELIRGVSRSLNVTITALNVAATLALALQTQKNVLRGVEAVNKTTDDLLAQTARQLKTQGTEIHKQAAGAQLDIDKLKVAFSDVKQALSDIGRFRREALPQMSQSIGDLNQLTGEMNSSLEKLEQGDSAQDEITMSLSH